MTQALRYDAATMPAWAAVCALVERTGMSFETAAETSLTWWRRWETWCQLRRDDPAPSDDED